MHMADTLISPIVGGTMWVATVGVAAYSIRKVKQDLDDSKLPLMGVMGAFVFAAQMINFSIPGTGASGHIGGGLILAALLGPYAGFLVMASVLAIQALFFGDGGTLAMGANIFNLGVFTCFVAFPLIFKAITRKGYSPRKIFVASLIAGIVGLQLGSLGVVLETIISGKTSFSFYSFLIFMQPIHLVIGVVEGFVTAAVIVFVWKNRPEILNAKKLGDSRDKPSIWGVVISFLVAAILLAGFVSWFASTNPDGLEWSLAKADAVGKVDIYGSAGILGGAATLLIVILAGVGIKFFKQRKANKKKNN